MSHFGILTIFCPIKIDLSGNTVWPQASGFQKPILASLWKPEANGQTVLLDRQTGHFLIGQKLVEIAKI